MGEAGGGGGRGGEGGEGDSDKINLGLTRESLSFVLKQPNLVAGSEEGPKVNNPTGCVSLEETFTCSFLKPCLLPC